MERRRVERLFANGLIRSQWTKMKMGRHAMKSRHNDKAEGKKTQLKGNAQEVARKLEDTGKGEVAVGNRKKIGKIGTAEEIVGIMKNCNHGTREGVR